MKSENSKSTSLKRFILRQPKNRIILVSVLILLLPAILYGMSLGVRVYNLYSTMHQSIDDEDDFLDPNELNEGEHEEIVDLDENEFDEDASDLTEEEREAIQIPDKDVQAYQFNDNQYYDLPRSERNPDLLHILLLGIDTTQIGGGGRSDTMMVVRFNKKTEEAAILSIPRDTYIKIPGRGFDKAGHAMAYGGTSLVKSTLEQYLDIHIDHYVRVDMRSLEIGVNALGGLNINVPQRMVHENGRVLFEAGRQYMDGEDILVYTRARKLISGGGTDFGRINRQQQVVIEMLRKIRQDLSLYQTLDFMEGVASYFRTDLTPGVVAGNWRAFNRIDLNEVKTVRIEGHGFMHNRRYYYRVPVKDARELMDSLAN